MKRYPLLMSLLLVAACSAAPEKKQPEAPAPQPQAQAPAPPVAPAPAPVAVPEKRASDSKSTSKPALKPVNKPLPPVASSQAPAPAQPQPVPDREPMPQQAARNAPIELPPPPVPVKPEPVIRKIVLPSGTLVNVRMIDSINSDTDHVGQAFKASIASPVVVDSETVIPKGADVFVKLVDVKSAGNIKGTSELRVQLDRLFVGGQSYVVESNTFTQTGASQGAKTAKTVGIGTAIGAVIGGITGGKKGAVIGAGAGAGAGTAVEAATKGEQVQIASESAMTFRLEAPIQVTLPPESNTSSRKPNQ
jgi:hypothetical protein